MPVRLLFRKSPEGSRRARFAKWWDHYVGSVAFVSVLILFALGTARTENARYEGCEGGNLLRQELREAEEKQIATTKATSPKLFPDIPLETFRRLRRESVHQSERLIRIKYAPRPCGTHIDLPLTNAQIILPLGD